MLFHKSNAPDAAGEFGGLLVRRDERPLLYAVLGFQAVCMLLLTFRGGSTDWFALRMAFLLPLGTYALMKLITKFWPVDRALYLCTAFLSALGVITLRSVCGDKAITQAMYLVPGAAALIFGILFSRLLTGESKLRYLAMIGLVGFMLLPFFLPTGSDSKSWVKLGARQFQPSELMKPVLIFILACGFSKGPRTNKWIGSALFAALVCVIIFLQKDLGAMFLYFMLTLAMFAVGTGRTKVALLVLAGAAAVSVFLILNIDKFSFLSTVSKRIAIWKDPWQAKPDDAAQIIQGLISVASGGLFGAGLGLSFARKVYVVASDYIFAAVAEEFGMVFAVAVIGIFLVILIRGMNTALNARSRFHALLSFGATFLLILQMLTIVMGNLKIIPLTGVTLPFVSGGGSSLVSSFLLMGMILGVSSINAQDEYDDLMQLKSEARRLRK